LTLDVGTAFWQQGFEDALGCLLVKAMLGRGGSGAECLFKERQTDTFRTAHRLERGGGPGLPFDHLGEESQSNRDDLPVLGKSGNRLIQE